MKAQTTTLEKMYDDLQNFMINEVRRVLPEAKKIIVYGAGARGAVIKSILKSLDLNIAYFLDSDPEKHNTTVHGIPTFNPAVIRDENKSEVFVLVAADYPLEMIKTLEILGLQQDINIKPVFDRFTIFEGTPYTGKMPLFDYTLGYNRMEDLLGFRLMTSPETQKDFNETLKIVILGNSTTDPEVADPLDYKTCGKTDGAFGSWPYFLHLLLNENGINHIVYNGAMSAYSSSQELLKFIRDGLILQPDLVISFNGINDTGSTYWMNKTYSKVHSHFNKVDNILKKNIQSSAVNIPSIEPNVLFNDTCSGLENEKSPWENWFENYRIIKAICREFNIEFLNLLQPGGLYLSSYINSCNVEYRIHWLLSHLFISWKSMSNAYESQSSGENFFELPFCEIIRYFINYSFGYDVLSGSICIKENQVDHFYNSAKRAAKEEKNISDLSEILNGIPDAYYDGCHCSMRSNRIIAEYVFKELNTRGILNSKTINQDR